MRFLRLLFWTFLVLLAVLFLGRNWIDVTVDLWGNLQADVKLPLLLILAFLMGYLPPAIVGRMRVWRLRRELALANRALAAAPAPLPAASPEMEQAES